ncbi:MAG: aminoglycoside phosphotransferase family protein [Mycobacterium sp.]|nr:aminoglycoside phosphotransferase family protein [Mycobacterium sp.]
MAEIPGSPADVTARWLTDVLSRPERQVVVDAVEVTPIGTGQTGATYRIAARYGSSPADLPDSFVVKLPAQDNAVRERVALSYRSEHAFYTGVADSVAVPVPRCHHCALADDGAQFVLLLDDMAPAEQADQIRGCTRAESELAVTALAGLHGPRWGDQAWLSFTGTVMPKPDEATARGLGDITKLAASTTIEKLGARMTEADRATVLESADLIADWLLGSPDRFSILHGDYRADNLLFGDGRVTVVDWQTLAVGLPARDLSYFLGTSLEPGERARHERALVESYHRALIAFGIEGYDTETCWQDYRFGMLQIPLITTLGFAFSAATERGDDMVLTMLERGSRAIRELGTLELVRGG